MSTREHLFGVVAALQPVLQGVSATDLDRPSPCEDWTVRDVAVHLLGTAEAMRRVGAGEPLDPQDPWGTGGGRLEDSWRDDLGDLLTAWAQAWSQPEAWEGDAMDGAVPRSQVGQMGFAEVVLHGWDIAAGTGQEVRFDDETVAEASEVMDEIGELGRSMHAFGPEVSVDDDASTFARVLGRSGRDPEWSRG
jgi:uncharacterized protein (TIGR03086 family)